MYHNNLEINIIFIIIIINTVFLEEDDKFKYVDNISILEFVYLPGLPGEYYVYSHVPSNVLSLSLHLQLTPTLRIFQDGLTLMNEGRSSFTVFRT